MTVSILLLLLGLPLLIWSSDKFVEGAIGVARSLGMSALLIGIIIVGFGTSIPEMLVSAIAALQGSPNLALGNAYGSNITNIALILGLTATLKPISVGSQILKRELPVLTVISGIAFLQLSDRNLSLLDSCVLLALFAFFVGWSIWLGTRKPDDKLGQEIEKSFSEEPRPLNRSLLWLIIGLVFLIISSRMLVEGAVTIAQKIGVSDLVIGLTIVAVGTSLPELASSVMAIRKGEHEIALGNIIGSNIFNSLAVVGISGVICPYEVPKEILFRDMPVMICLTVALFLMASGFGRQGRINRIEGAILLLCYLSYIAWLTGSVT